MIKEVLKKMPQNGIEPSASLNDEPTTSNFINDWDDAEFDMMLSQLACSVDLDQKCVTKGQQKQQSVASRVMVREVVRAPKRNFSPSFVRNISSSQHKTAPTDPVAMSQDEKSLLSQDNSLKYKAEVERLKKELSLKDGECKVMRDRKNEAEKELFNLRNELNAYEQRFVRQKDDLEIRHNQEKTKLLTEKQFLEKEKREIERAVTLEKAARQKAEFLLMKSGVNEQIFTSGAQHKRPQLSDSDDQSRLANPCSQFPGVQEFYAPTVVVGKKKRRAAVAPSAGNCGKVPKLDELVSLVVPSVQYAVQQSKLDVSAQTEHVEMRFACDLTQHLEYAKDRAWFIRELQFMAKT